MVFSVPLPGGRARSSTSCPFQHLMRACSGSCRSNVLCRRSLQRNWICVSAARRNAAIYASWRELRLDRGNTVHACSNLLGRGGQHIRIAAVAIAHERYATDLSKGTEHDVLGSATYVASLLLLIMTEQVICCCLILLQSTLHQNPACDFERQNGWRHSGTMTIQDRDHRTNQYLERSLSGRRLDTSRFLIIVGLLLAAGSAVESLELPN